MEKNELNREHEESMKEQEHALCECGEPVPEAEHCKYCGKYMPSGDDQAEEMLALSERNCEVI